MEILLADHHNDVRSALRLLLEQQAGCRVAGEAVDAINLLAQVARCCPQAVILDTELAGIQPNGRRTLRSLVELIETLHLLCPRTRVIALSRKPRLSTDQAVPGADAQISMGDPPEVLLALLASYSTTTNTGE